MIVEFPYGEGKIPLDIPGPRLRSVLRSSLEEYRPPRSEEALIEEALAAPLGSAPLAGLACGKREVVVIASDHTRPVPSRLIMPRLLREIRKGSPGANITILVATGCHRAPTREELTAKFGPDIVQNERIVIHDCDAQDNVFLGTLPSGGGLYINGLAARADLLAAEGFIEPHFFAGFSGGRKSVLPGIAARKTVLYNHNAAFIAHPCARSGCTGGNPIHEDMAFAARAARLAFICNVVINGGKNVVYAAAGAPEAAHSSGCAFLSARCAVPAAEADIVITGNGGHPLDQNIYQAVKGMTAAEACVRPNGVIIMLAASGDGHGGAEFFRTFEREKDRRAILAAFHATPKEETRVDQWQSQIFIRVLERARVIYVSDAPDDMVRALHMTPARSPEEALSLAGQILDNPNASVTAIPDGVGVIVTPHGR